MAEANKKKAAGNDIVAFVEDPLSRDVAAKFAAASGSSESRVLMGTIAKACDYLADNASPQLLIVDISSSDDVLRDIRFLADVCDSNVQVIAIGDKDEINLYRQLLAEGVRDYLVKPIGLNQLRAAFEHGFSGASGGVAVTFISAHGGAGATTFALSCAGIIAHHSRRYTCLLDGDLIHGPMAMIADRKPGRSLIEALKSPGRIDNVFLDRALEKIDERISLLCGRAEASDDLRSFSTDSYAELFRVLQERFRYLFIDGPRWIDAYRNAAFKVSSHIVLVSHPTLIGLRNVIDVMSSLEKIYDPSRLSVVLNSCGCHKRGEISRDQFSKAMRREVAHSIRFDPHNVLSWTNTGKVFPEQGIFAQDMRRMIQGLFPQIVDIKRGFLSNLKTYLSFSGS